MMTEHKGLPVRKHSAAVRGASGDALNGALKVTPQDFIQGVPYYMVLEVMPDGENYKPMDDGEAWEEIEVVKVKRGSFIPAKDALPYLDDVSRKLEDLRVAETGQARLELDPGKAEGLTLEHEQGLHKRKRQACPICHPTSDADIARGDELAARREAHGDGEGDADNPLPGARKRRSRAPGAAKRTPKKRTPAKK